MKSQLTTYGEHNEEWRMMKSAVSRRTVPHTSPSTASFGTRQPSRTSSQVEDARMPNLSSWTKRKEERIQRDEKGAGPGKNGQRTRKKKCEKHWRVESSAIHDNMWGSGYSDDNSRSLTNWRSRTLSVWNYKSFCLAFLPICRPLLSTSTTNAVMPQASTERCFI